MKKIRLATGLAAAGLLTVTAISTEATAKKDTVKIAVVTHSDGGVFWSVFKKGAEKAAADLGVTLDYQEGNNDGTKQASEIEQALANGAQGLAVSLASPDAVKDAVKKFADAGLPIVTVNSGSNLYKEFGAFTHIGQDETIAGNGAGERFKAAGVKHVLCVKQEQSNVGLDARCDGAKETYGGTFDVKVTSGDASGKQQGEIKAFLEADPSIDAVFGTGPVIAHDAAAAATELGRKIMIGGVDLSKDILTDIAGGSVDFTIDQQQYLQGYVGVLALYLNITNKNTLGGGLPINTGPGFVTKDNAEAVSKLVDAGTR